jgi:hypothetical protein
MASIIKDTRHLQELNQQNQKKTQEKNEKKSAQQVIDLEVSPSPETSILKKLVDTPDESSVNKKRNSNKRQRKESSSSESSVRSRSSSPEIISTVSSKVRTYTKKSVTVESKKTAAKNSNKLPLPKRSDVILTNVNKTINSQTYITPVASGIAASSSFSSPTFINTQMQSPFQIYTPNKADTILTNRNLNLNSQALLIQPQIVNKSGQGLIQMQQSQPPIFLPANFNGTILIQPTIHIHGNSKLNNIINSKYRQIIPKGGGSQNNANKKK